jgi:Conserved protein/domain typically associated with flavoprotein oxygenases, DIM6/NTAB family
MAADDFEPFDWKSYRENASELFSRRWALISAGAMGSWNTMTASWGGFGNLWNMDVAFIFVRPSRHSYGFIEKSDGFTLSFFAPERHRVLEICGAKSGRDTDKALAAGITPREFSSRAGVARIGFDEAELVLSCRKAYAHDLDPKLFIDPGIAEHYANGDLHRAYIGAIEGAWRRAASRR